MSEALQLQTVISQAFPAGEVDQYHPGEDGNVLDRLCPEFRRLQAVGRTPCQDCVFFDPNVEIPAPYSDKLCAHRNLLAVLSRNDIDPERTLMFAATAHKVGVYSQLVEAGEIEQHAFGWQVAKGYNAVYATTDELQAEGLRAADCSIVKGRRSLPDGRTLMLEVHMTRDNIEGDSARSFGEDKDRSFLQHALQIGSDYYGMSYEEFVSEFHLEQMAKINQLDYTFKAETLKDGRQLTAEQNMDRLFKGWFDQGMLHNLTKPGWKRGDLISPDDEWRADYQEMTEYIIRTSGVPLENIDTTQAVDPGVVESGHASNAAANDPKRPAERRRPEARDAYLVVSPPAAL